MLRDVVAVRVAGHERNVDGGAVEPVEGPVLVVVLFK
jgi:hypothetical protein